MNRLGRNIIGTVGEPLPETELKVAEDGELLVRGPQVMQGYLGEEKAEVFEDDWLFTGDLGKITDAGDLVIFGRKKELISTSYGKMISVFKIESMIKDLDGVDEVMLVGEGRPYVSALIWSNQAEQGPGFVELIEKGVVEVNNDLSRVEQVRSWVVLKNDLEVDSGDLTPNFKLKRHNVFSRFEKIIDSLYDSEVLSDSRIMGYGRSKT
jgi:long-chain acyl-CoA synthetase